MLATFVLVGPVWVAVAFVAVVAMATYARTARRGVVLAVSLAALSVGAMLVVAKTPVAHALLLVFSAAAALLLSVETYRRRRTKLNPGSAAVCVLARALAWLAVLLVIGRPRWDWVVVEWEKPLLVALLDQSNSMSITDDHVPEARSRAALVNRAFDQAQPWLGPLDALYEVRAFGVGEDSELLDDWQVLPRAPISALAAALRQAAQARTVQGEPAVAVLLVSDGAENAVNPRVVPQVAAELAAQRTAVLAVGVGPAAELTPAVLLEPLVVPGQIGSRDRVRVPVAARVTGCAGRVVQVALLWGDQQAAERQVQIEQPAQAIDAEFELQPPGVGLHRLTARMTLPADLGGESFETSIIVDVRDDRIRVLMLEGQPRNELAFALRAVGGDPRFEVTQRLLLAATAPPRAAAPALLPRWSNFDVVILGNIPAKRLSFDALAELADAVRQRGVGLLMVGGRDFYHEGYFSRSELLDVSPVELRLSRPADDYHPRFQPTAAGRRHPVLLGIGESTAAVGGNVASDPRVGRGEGRATTLWDRLPPLGGAARFGKAKPLATILATDAPGRPLLAVMDVGRGRSIAAAWDSTWPWVLSSEEGLAAHGKLWRQMVAWLANRRPVAWVVTDRSGYVRAALAGGQQRVQVRAGLSGVETPSDRTRRAEFDARLQLRFVRADGGGQVGPPAQSPSSAPASQPTSAPPVQRRSWSIPLKRCGNEWRAELPQDLQTQAWLTSGVYELTFVVKQAAGRSSAAASPVEAGDGRRLVLSARTGFTVTATDLELLEPTANLALLREAAATTAPVGGAYYPIDALPDALRLLAENDRRRRIEHAAAYDLVERQPWLLLAVVVGALALEWVVRKRGGMA